MSVLRTIESKIEGLFEGIFGRAFRTNVQPIELARKLVKEMEENRNVSVSRVYVPNEYAIYLSPEDRESFASYEESLRTELEQYLADHARREGLALLGDPHVSFHTDEDLDLGQFGIATRMAPGAAPPPQTSFPEGLDAPEVGATMIYPAARPAAPTPPVDPPAAPVQSWLEVDGRRVRLGPGALVVGRSKDAGLQIDDANASRRHARIEEADGEWFVADLDSTNGTKVNDRTVRRAPLADGDRVTIGSTTLVYRRGLP